MTNRAKAAVRGAICGDIIGSYYERRSTKDINFPLFTRFSRPTDDTVCTIAVADALTRELPMAATLQSWCRRYPHAGYGRAFRYWMTLDEPQPYGSFGNGSAMRVSPVGAWARTVGECLALAEASAAVSHNHPEGIKGAQAVALAVFMAIRGKTKEELKGAVEELFGYDLSRSYAAIQPEYHFDVTCQGSVPEAIICFLESTDYESAVRRAVALGGDADTQAAIAGAIAAAYYGEIPEAILSKCMAKLSDDMTAALAAFDTALAAR